MKTAPAADSGLARNCLPGQAAVFASGEIGMLAHEIATSGAVLGVARATPAALRPGRADMLPPATDETILCDTSPCDTNASDGEAYHWGEFSLGPVSDTDLDRLDALLEDCGLSWPNRQSADPTRIVPTLGGNVIQIEGEGVTGYLWSAEDALEAEKSQLRQLGHELLTPGARIVIDGTHQVDEHCVVHVKTIIHKTGARLRDVAIERATCRTRPDTAPAIHRPYPMAR